MTSIVQASSRNDLLRLAVLLALGLGFLWLYGRQGVQQAWAARHHNDFKHMYLGAVLAREGRSPYDREALFELGRLAGIPTLNPYVYLPFTAQAMMPLAWLSFPRAADAWFVVNQLLLWAGVLALLSTHPSAESPPLARLAMLVLMAGACGASFAFYRTLTAGQLNMVLFASFAGVFALLAHGHQRSAGVLAAFAALFKVTPGILIIYFLVSRRWRVAAAMTIAGTLMLAASVAHIGPRTWLEFLPLARDMSYGSSTWGDANTFYRDPFNQSLNSFLHHVLADRPGETRAWIDLGPAWANRLTTLGALAVLTITVGTGLLMNRAKHPQRDDAAPPDPMPPADRALYAAFVMASLLIPSLMWDHYMTIAMAAWGIILLMPPQPGGLPGSARVACMMAVALALGYPLAHGQPAWREGAGLLMMSARLWPCILLWLVCVVWAWRWHRAAQQATRVPGPPPESSA